MDFSTLRPRLIHTMLHVTDMDRSLAFYCGTLGMSVAVERENKETGHRNVFLGFPAGNGGAELELTSYRDRTGYTHGDAYGHVGLGVEDCAAACAFFAAQGVEVVRDPKVMPSGAVIAFIVDPDGYQLEVVQPAPARP